jgi:hypothetical protein
MKRFLATLLVLMFALAVGACTSDKDRGVNKDKDKPQVAKDAD